MRVIVAGGGTGGHVFPAISVVDEFVRRGADVLYVGTKSGFEASAIPKRGWNIEYLSAPRWKGQGRLGQLMTLLRLPFVIFQGMRIIARFDPEIVVGVGGYVSLPVLLAAVIKRCPTLIMEQNSIPGLANRLLGKFVKKVCVTYPVSEKFFSLKKTILTGNPVRSEILEVQPHLPPEDDKFTVLCFGGSQGAKKINEAMMASLRYLRGKSHSIRFMHQIGSSMDVQIVKDIYEKEGFEAEVYRFIDDIADCYARSHLVICRAGASSISELMVVARPALLVPYPFASNDHQTENAKYIVESGGAIMVTNDELSGERISDVIMNFMEHPERLTEMAGVMKKLSRPRAATEIVDECYKLAVK